MGVKEVLIIIRAITMKQEMAASCLIKPEIRPEGLREHRQYMIKFFRRKPYEPGQRPYAFFVGPITGLGQDMQEPKEKALEYSSRLLDQSGYHATSAEAQGLGYDSALSNQEIRIACQDLMLSADILVGISPGKPSTGTGEEMGEMVSLGIPYTCLEFDLVRPARHLSSSPSTAGDGTRVFFQVDCSNESDMEALLEFYKSIREPLASRKVGIGSCDRHGRTHYFVTGRKPVCFHGLAEKTGIRKETLEAKVL